MNRKALEPAFLKGKKVVDNRFLVVGRVEKFKVTMISFKMLAAILCLLALTPSATGFLVFQQRIPNGNNVPHPCKDKSGWPGVGHINAFGEGAKNPFGEDFDNAGKRWTEELCGKDSDGDGSTNGEELGDPNCNWKEDNGAPETSVDITHPGICQPMESVNCQGKNDFVSCD